MRLIVLFSFFTTISLSLFSQKNSTALQVGDSCPSIIVNTSGKSIQSFVFPRAGKLTMIHFWSSSNPESMQDFYRFSVINQKYTGEEYKSAEGFDMILVALQNDLDAWKADLKKYNLLAATNGICLKGLDDFYVKNFKLTATPATLIVDENGKIISVNPDVNLIVRLLNDKRNYTGEEAPVSKISGQILIGNGSVTPLANEKIYVINHRRDTVQTTSTNGAGKFTLSEEKMEGITLNIHKSQNIAENADLLLANERGVVVAGFAKGTDAFEYRLLQLELSFLKPLPEPEVKVKSFIRDLYFSENLYEDGGYLLSQKSKAKLDALLTKFKGYPGATVEIISHSDCRGSSELNQTLSLKRSKSVANYFISKGISASKIKTIGRGEEEPVNGCVDGVPCSEKELAENRRTEFRFYKSE